MTTIKTPIYMTDLDISKQNDNFLGKGTKKLIEKAEKEDKQIIVGYFIEKPIFEE